MTEGVARRAPTLSDLLRASSRTFAIGIERLPGELRETVRLSYLLLRVSDYLEDNEEMAPGRKVALLSMWDGVLAGSESVERFMAELSFPDPITSDALVASHVARLLAALNALPHRYREPVVRHVRDSTRGMARWTASGPRIVSEADLDDYMHEVAGRVGYLLTDLFSAHSLRIRRRRERLLPLSREFGLGLQTVNVIRGLRKDYERGWIYVPESYVSPYGITREELFDVRNSAVALRVLDRLVLKAEHHLRAAEEYTRALPRRDHAIRLACLYPLMFAVRTLAVSRRNALVFESEAKITRSEVRRIVRRSTLLGWSNRWIGSYARRLAEVG
ncbi:MAG: squalene/phytoene synthase family protein [Gemmatimonadaceae bacterium]